MRAISKKLVAILISVMFIFAITDCAHEQVTYDPELESYADIEDVAIDPESEAPAVVEETIATPEPEPEIVTTPVHYVSAVYVAKLTQASVDTNDVVYTQAFGNMLVAGHDYGSLGNIVNWRAGDEVYLNGIHLKVVTSKPAWVEKRDSGPFADTICDGTTECGDYPYQFYTCYSAGRWFVNAVAI